MKAPCRTPGRRSVSLVLLFIGLLIVYAFFVEPAWLRTTTVRIHNAAFSTILHGRRIAFLSDLHIGETRPAALEKARVRLRALRPDLILLAGDYVRWDADEPAYRKAIGFLAELEAPLGVYAVLGDADFTKSRFTCLFCHGEKSTAPTTAHRVVMLRNRSVDLPIPGARLRLTGLRTDPDIGKTHLAAGLLDDPVPTLVLTQTSLPYRDIPADRDVLVLAGDTHGGQVRLPSFFWHLTNRKPDPDHIYGYFEDGRKALYVTSGVGTSRPHLRLGRRPEIVVLEFGCKDNKP